jgi:anti-anti-sigma factor
VRPDGDLDDKEAEAVRGRIAAALRQGAATVRLDFSAVRNVAPAGLALLARAARAAARRAPPATFQLANASAEVRTLLRLTQLESSYPAAEGA